MWWSNYWQAPWMFLGPMKMLLVLTVICIAVNLLAIRMRFTHRATGETSPGTAGEGFVLLSQHVDARQADGRHVAFEEYRNEALRRADQDEKEFRELMAYLRMANRPRFGTGAFDQAFGSN